MTMVSVLVTGGAGFVGSHTCKLLAARGILPVTFDSLANGHREMVCWGPLVVGDIRDKAAIRKAIADHQAEAVFHFAALAYIGESMMRPDAYYDVNVAGTMALLAAMRETSVTKLIFSSSCATYGLPDRVPINENEPQRPINPYGRTKLIGEQMVTDHAEAFGLRYAVLRYFNAAGCDMEGNLAEKHDPEPHLIPRALMAAAGFGQPLQIHGTDYDTPDGTAIRDYVHVDDLAVAHHRALDRVSNGQDAIVLNIGSGRGYSVREVLCMVERVTGRKVPVSEGPRRAGDPPVLIAATERATNMLDFVPQYSDLETIVRTAWRGIQSVCRASEVPGPEKPRKY